MNYPQTRRAVSLSARISPRFAPALLTRLEHWQVQRHLGTGASAQVWLLEHRASKHQLACKVPQAAEDHAVLSQEAKLARDLEHENLVQNLDGDVLDGLAPAQHAGATFWEFLPAGSLATLVGAAGALNISQTVTVLLPMIQVAEYLHNQHIVHGDFSPANILFDLTGRPVLIDLGAVRATAHAFHTTGTPGFIAPEVNTSPSSMESLGTAADVYSLAAIGWFCLTATTPGLPQTRVPLATLQPDLSSELVEVLEACLSASPTLRPSTSRLLDAVARWAEPEPLDLFASAGEEYELLLPTRKPLNQEHRSHRRSMRGRMKRNTRRRKTDPVPDRSVRSKTLRRRILLGLGTCGLLAAVIGTNIHAGQILELSDAVEEEQTEASHDFQAVVDELAQVRGQAWADADPSQVGHYALKNSEAYQNDLTVLTQMQEAGTVLDDIRMRAVVNNIRHTPRETILEVEWRIDAYTQRDRAGRKLQAVPARTEHLALRVSETAKGWRLRSVETL